MKKLISMDMATKSTGWAFFDEGQLTEYGVLKANDDYIYSRLLTMRSQIREILELHQPDIVVVEEVPISNSSNLDVGKNLCILQGMVFGVCSDLGIEFKTISPSVWREKIGLHRSLYTCEKCGAEFEGKSGLRKLECKPCGNTAFSKFKKTQLNKRNDLKERAVKETNSIYGLSLFFKRNSAKSDDDIAESILLGLSELKHMGEADGNL